MGVAKIKRQCCHVEPDEVVARVVESRHAG
jgi:hypothetical protein